MDKPRAKEPGQGIESERQTTVFRMLLQSLPLRRYTALVMHGNMPPRSPGDRYSHPVARLSDGRTKEARRLYRLCELLTAELGGIKITDLVRAEIRKTALLMVTAESLVERAGWQQSVDLDKMLRVQAAADRARDRLMKRAKVKR